MERIGRAALLAIVVALAAATAGQAVAHGRWGGGVWFGIAPPLYVAPYPAYGPSPYYAAPPPAASEGCYAGPYVCPLEAPSRIGMPCSCPTSQGQAWGRAR